MFSLRFVPLSIAFVSFSVSGLAQEETPARLVEAVALTRDIPIDDNSLERILGIRKIVGTFQLSEHVLRLEDAVHSVKLRVDLYRNGQLLQVKMAKPGLGGREVPRHGQFLVQIVDLDHLKLGDAPSGHWRVFISVMMTNSPNGRGVKSGPQQIDIPKSQFDAQPRTSMIGRFTEFPDKTVRDIPLFFSASGRILKHGSLPELLKENPESDVLVGVIELR